MQHDTDPTPTPTMSITGIQLRQCIEQDYHDFCDEDQGKV